MATARRSTSRRRKAPVRRKSPTLAQRWHAWEKAWTRRKVERAKRVTEREAMAQDRKAAKLAKSAARTAKRVRKDVGKVEKKAARDARMIAAQVRVENRTAVPVVRRLEQGSGVGQSTVLAVECGAPTEDGTPCQRMTATPGDCGIQHPARRGRSRPGRGLPPGVTGQAGSAERISGFPSWNRGRA